MGPSVPLSGLGRDTERPTGAAVGLVPATYARQRPNQLVRASVSHSRLFDGVQPGQAQSTVAPLGVSSSLASSSGKTPKMLTCSRLVLPL